MKVALAFLGLWATAVTTAVLSLLGADACLAAMLLAGALFILSLLPPLKPRFAASYTDKSTGEKVSLLWWVRSCLGFLSLFLFVAFGIQSTPPPTGALTAGKDSGSTDSGPERLAAAKSPAVASTPAAEEVMRTAHEITCRFWAATPGQEESTADMQRELMNRYGISGDVADAALNRAADESMKMGERYCEAGPEGEREAANSNGTNAAATPSDKCEGAMSALEWNCQEFAKLANRALTGTGPSNAVDAEIDAEMDLNTQLEQEAKTVLDFSQRCVRDCGEDRCKAITDKWAPLTAAGRQAAIAEIIVKAPPNTREEEAAGLRALCGAYRDAPESDPTLKDPANAIRAVTQADQTVATQLNEPFERANIIVTCVAKAFAKGIYGPSDCEQALLQ
jgi:hypothetical protein